MHHACGVTISYGSVSLRALHSACAARASIRVAVSIRMIRRPVSDDRCQQIGAKLRALGASGLVAPSAARPDGLNLIVFKRMVRGDWTEQPQGSPVALQFPGKVLPVCLAAVGHPPSSLLRDVRHKENTSATAE